ncbi:MAG: hypothetical protein ACR2NZ_01590 [Rubripirellula sp.]
MATTPSESQIAGDALVSAAILDAEPPVNTWFPGLQYSPAA